MSDINVQPLENKLKLVGYKSFLLINNKMTIEELTMTDFFFQPHYNKPWGMLNQVALKSLLG